MFQATRNGAFIGRPQKTKELAQAIIRREKESDQRSVFDGWITQEQHDATKWEVIQTTMNQPTPLAHYLHLRAEGYKPRTACLSVLKQHCTRVEFAWRASRVRRILGKIDDGFYRKPFCMECETVKATQRYRVASGFVLCAPGSMASFATIAMGTTPDAPFHRRLFPTIGIKGGHKMFFEDVQIGDKFMWRGQVYRKRDKNVAVYNRPNTIKFFSANTHVDSSLDINCYYHKMRKQGLAPRTAYFAVLAMYNPSNFHTRRARILPVLDKIDAGYYKGR